MSDSTYTARLVSSAGTETVELEFIGGLPQKSFVRAVGGDFDDEEMIWELVNDDSDGYEYREAGRPGADYS